MISYLIITVALCGQVGSNNTQRGTLYNNRNSSRGLNNQGFNYYRYNNTTRQEQATPYGRNSIYGQKGIYSNGVRRQTSGNHTYDYGKYNRMGITREFGGGTRTYWSNGQVDTQRGIQFEHRNYNPNFPLNNTQRPRR